MEDLAEVQPKPRLKIWKPVWAGTIEGMVVNMINRNLWRFTPLYEFDDIYQQCYLFFLICCEKYPHVIEEAHFCALMKTCLFNEFNTLARSRSGMVTNVDTAGKDEGDLIQQIPDRPVSRDEEFEALLEQAPDEIKALVAGLSRPGRPRKLRKGVTGKRETTNSFLCRLAGLDPKKVDLRAMLDNLVSPA